MSACDSSALQKYEKSKTQNTLNHFSELVDIHLTEKQISQQLPEHVTLDMFIWPSGHILQLMSELFAQIKWNSVTRDFKSLITQTGKELIQSSHRAWRSARNAADDESRDLLDHILNRVTQGQVLHVIGHSLGGRMILRAMETDNESRKAVLNLVEKKQLTLNAWAPAITNLDLHFENLSVQYYPELIYSQNDWVLKNIFPLGELPYPAEPLIDIPWNVLKHSRSNRYHALGYDPTTYSPNRTVQVELTHLDYIPNFKLTCVHSRNLSQLYQ